MQRTNSFRNDQSMSTTMHLAQHTQSDIEWIDKYKIKENSITKGKTFPELDFLAYMEVFDFYTWLVC